MNRTAKIYSGIVLFIVAAILGFLIFGTVASGAYAQASFSLIPEFAIVSIALFIAGIWLIVSNIKIKTD